MARRLGEERVSTSSNESLEWARICGAPFYDTESAAAAEEEDNDHHTRPSIDHEQDDCLMSWEFDAFAIASEGAPLVYVTNLIMKREKLDISRPELVIIFQKVFQEAQVGYNDMATQFLPSSALVATPVYHTAIHGADVCQAYYYLLRHGRNRTNLFDRIVHVSGDEVILMFACIFASAMHDYRHPGVTNDFLIRSNSKLAMMYNDKSILENFHCSAAFELLALVMGENHCRSGRPEDILSRLEYRKFRQVCISLILSTDMANHYELVSRPPCPAKDYMHCLQLGLHCADVSSSARPWSISRVWANLIMEEFFFQGDLESQLGLVPITPMMDRSNACIDKIQVSFIDMIVRPLFVHMQIVCPFLGGADRGHDGGGERHRCDGQARDGQASRHVGLHSHRSIIGYIEENREKWAVHHVLP